MITFEKLGWMGRMGNQLYQYAFLTAAAARIGHDLAIPARCRRWTGQRRDLWENGLAGFRLEVDTHGGDIRPQHRYAEPIYAEFDPVLLHPEDGTDFEGYFQDYRYFADAEPRLRREFRFIPEIEDRAAAIVDGWRVAGRPIVSVTVRRGDYLHEQCRDRYRVLSAPELNAAMTLFGEATFAIGSDDLDWCHVHFQGDQFRVIPQDCSWTALAIASLCDHHIISASTFSWWGAWLGTTPGKRVLHPDPWYSEARLEACCPPPSRHPRGWEPIPTDRRDPDDSEIRMMPEP